MYLNIFEGCEEKERFKKIVSFINQNKPNILALSELYKWERENLKKFKSTQQLMDYENSYYGKANTTGNLGFFSNLPFKEVSNVTEGMVHSFMKGKITIKGKEIAIFLTHLTAMEEYNRLDELKALLPEIQKEENVILLGDLNSLSPKDNYDEEKLLKLLKEQNIKKFGQEKLKKCVQTKLLEAGLIDAVREFSDEFEYSVPTTYNKDMFHFEKLRLDYIYISKSLRPFLKNAKIIRTEETNQLSDHFPIVAEFDFT
tara:strand:+ start:648 stop:1418 length:771 start_codon:yes stop_codon:yes gene_type:complete